MSASGINAPPVSYSVNGKQYIAVLVGSRQSPFVWGYAPELKNTATASMLTCSGCKPSRPTTPFAGVTFGSRRRLFRAAMKIRKLAIAIAAIAGLSSPLAAALGDARKPRSRPKRRARSSSARKSTRTRRTASSVTSGTDPGDQGYGGNALSLRATKLTQEQLVEVIKCGRPLTAMPYHDQFAYTDKRCFDMTREDLGKDMPAMGEALQPREITAVVKYLFARVVGRGPATYDDCVDFWGKDTRQCEPMKK